VPRTLAVINQKGGCGKTTTSINLAATLAASGYRTLLVDVDPQAHCALGLAVPEQHINHSVADAMLSVDSQTLRREDLIWQINGQLDLLPASTALATVERRLADAMDRDLRLAGVLRQLGGGYDFILIDCPPNIGLLTFNALRAAGEVMIPVETSYFALKGAGKQVATIRVMGQRCGHLPKLHVLPTLYDVRVRNSREILADLTRQFGEAVLPVAIHYASKLREAASFGQPITEYDPSCRSCQDFRRLAEHLTAHPPGTGFGDAPGQPATETSAPADTAAAELGAVPSVDPAPAAGAPAASAQPPAPAAEPHGSSHGVDADASTDAQPLSRAAELAQRARALADRTQRLQARFAADPNVGHLGKQPNRPKSDGRIDHAERQRNLARKLARLYGVRKTETGALFVQPTGEARRIAVAGDFNNWSPDATPMRYNQQLDVFEASVSLPAGRHAYRLVIDGRWTTDPHNDRVVVNEQGEPNNIVEV